MTTDHLSEPLQKLLEYCDLSDDACQGTLSVTLVRELIGEEIADRKARATAEPVLSDKQRDEMPILHRALLNIIGEYGLARTDGASEIERIHRWQVLIDEIKFYAREYAALRAPAASEVQFIGVDDTEERMKARELLSCGGKYEVIVRAPAASVAPEPTAALSLIDRLEGAFKNFGGWSGTPGALDAGDASNSKYRWIERRSEQWGTADREGKQPGNWFWLVGELASRALHHHKEAERLHAENIESGEGWPIITELNEKHIAHHREKAVHHCITAAAALSHWHASVLGKHTEMQPGHAASVDLAESLS